MLLKKRHPNLINEILSLMEKERRISVLAEMERDAVAFFSQVYKPWHQRNGLLGKWAYDGPQYEGDPVRGGALWDAFTVAHSAYYPKANQIRLIGKNTGWLHETVGKKDVIVDFGCGGKEAISQQTIPLLFEFCEVSAYIPVDLSREFSLNAAWGIWEAFPEKIIDPQITDYTRPVKNIRDGRKLGLFFGSSTNFSMFPWEFMTLMKSFSLTLNRGQHIAMIIDTNIDKDRIIASYDHPLHAEQEVNVLHRLKRDLPITGDFDPGAWDYKIEVEYMKVWQMDPVAVGYHVLVPRRDQSFMIRETPIQVRAGEQYISDKSYKFSLRTLDKLCEAVALERVGHKYDHEGHLVMPVYRII